MLLQIARGLMVSPIHLFLMDEPFAGVHPTIKDTIMETILRMNREEAVTFLIVSHEMATLRRLCLRVSVMHEGQLIAEGSEEHTSELQSLRQLVCRLLLEKKTNDPSTMRDSKSTRLNSSHLGISYDFTC